MAWLGRPAASPYEDQVEIYRQRVHRRWPAEDRPLRPAGGGRDKDPLRSLRQEAAVVERLLDPGWRFVALDEGGRSRDSESFARRLERFEDAGTNGLLFAVGSDLGLHADLLGRADECFSLSPMTLPHLLARLILWEQLFRATHILGGGAYHRFGVQ